MDKRIVVVGAGAIGGYTGGNLAHNGFDVTLVDPWPEHIEAIRIPIITGGAGGGPLGDLDWLGAHRVRVALQTHAPFSAAVQAVYNTLKALREGTKPSDLTGIASSELMQKVTRAGEYRQWTRDFLGGE